MSKDEFESAAGSLSSSAKAVIDAALVAQLKAALIAKDARIEQLELANRRMMDQLDRVSQQPGGEDRSVRSIGPGRAEPVSGAAEGAPSPVPTAPQPRAPPPPSKTPASPGWTAWSLPIASEFVRMVAPAVGIYRDFWTEPHFSAPLLAERALGECTLELWLKADGSDSPASIIARIDGVERHTARVEFGGLNRVRFAIDVAAGTIFELALTCDYVKPVQSADKRRVSYILRSLNFA